jgi:hypothetical protein
MDIRRQEIVPQAAEFQLPSFSYLKPCSFYQFIKLLKRTCIAALTLPFETLLQQASIPNGV